MKRYQDEAHLKEMIVIGDNERRGTEAMAPNQLLYVKNKNDTQFRDKTDEYATLSFDGSRYRITYNGNDTEYPYPAEQVALCIRKHDIDLDGHEIFNLKTDPPTTLRNVKEATYYESNNSAFESRYRVSFEGKKEPHIFLASNINVIRLAHSYPIFRYLQELCEAIKPKDEQEKVREYLPKQFKGLRFLDGTAAACFIDPNQNRPEKHPDSELIIYPFGSNLSQMQAIDNALSNQVSLIEGPPGTGKTQTILNILANLIFRGKTSLVVSPNNEATKNISKKLNDPKHDFEFGFLAAALGRKDNCDDFVADQPEYPSRLSEWDYSEDIVCEAKEYVSNNSSTLREIFQKERALAKLRTELAEWKLEFNHFLVGYESFESLACRSRTTSERIIELRSHVAQKAIQGRPIGFFPKLEALILRGVGRWSDYKMQPVDLEISLNRTLFEKQISLLENQIDELETSLVSRNAGRLIKAVTEKSLLIFQSYIYKKYSQRMAGQDRVKFDNPWREPVEFRDEYPIITSTTNAARNQIGKNGDPFDYVIIDESSQADLITGMLALSAAKNAVVVGDVKQLPCVITEEEKKKSKTIEEKNGVPELYSYAEQSLLSSLADATQEGVLSAPRQLLKEHYRCHPEIIGFCNQMFYDDELIVMSDSQSLSSNEALYLSPTHDCNYDRTKDYNRQQAGQFKDDVLPVFEQYCDHSQIGVATPYRAQAEHMKRDEQFEGIEIDTVHKYQGREKNAIAFITKANKINSFVNNPNLINVAVSRAKLQLSLIAAPELLRGTNNIADLGHYIMYHDGGFIKASVSSSFDLLYKNHTHEREHYLAKRNVQDDQYSEVQTEEWISEILKSLGCCTHLGYLRNYPLKQFLIDLDPFNEEERRFINTQAHADFLFYKRSDKSVAFVLEVNGGQHDYPQQVGRDRTKASILSKAYIPLDVLRTNEYDPRKYLSEIIEKHISEDETKTTIRVAVKDKDNPWGELLDQ